MTSRFVGFAFSFNRASHLIGDVRSQLALLRDDVDKYVKAQDERVKMVQEAWAKVDFEAIAARAEKRCEALIKERLEEQMQDLVRQTVNTRPLFLLFLETPKMPLFFLSWTLNSGQSTHCKLEPIRDRFSRRGER